MNDKLAFKYGITLVTGAYLGIVAIKNKREVAKLQKENAKLKVENALTKIDNVIKRAKIRELEAELEKEES